MTTGYPLGLCTTRSSALPCQHLSLRRMAGCPLLTIALEGRSMKHLPSPLSGELWNVGLMRTEWKAQIISGASWGEPGRAVPAQRAPKTAH